MTKKVSNGFIRQAVYSKYNGHCAYCGCEIGYQIWNPNRESVGW